MPADIDFAFNLPNDSEFRDQLAYALSPVLGTILEDNGDGTYDVDASDGDGGELIARPLDQRTYSVGDFVWCMLAFSTTDSAIILGSYNPAPDLLTAGAINLGDENLDTYNQGTWTPEITLSTTPPTTLTYTTQSGQYTQIGNVVVFSAIITINAYTIGAGAGDVRCSLPVAVPNLTIAQNPCNCITSGVDLGASTRSVAFRPTQNTSYGIIREVQDNAAATATQAAALAAGDTISYAGMYFAA